MSTRPPNARPGRRFAAGQGLAEYALLVALIAVVAIGGAAFLGTQISATLSSVGTQFGGGPAVISVDPTIAPSEISSKKACIASGYTWVKKPKPGHCT